MISSKVWMDFAVLRTYDNVHTKGVSMIIKLSVCKYFEFHELICFPYISSVKYKRAYLDALSHPYRPLAQR